MRKSTIIATCLVNSRMFSRMEDAEAAIRNIFADEFPTADFADWNREMNDRAADDIINMVGRASRINVKSFIEDLWQK